MINRNIRLKISYDGTDFSGWQIQNNDRTVQAVLEDALSVMHKHPVRVTASGRTDSGVHASGQIVNFCSDIKDIPGANFVYALNSLLPRDVRVMESIEAEQGFHARYDAKIRVYKYYIISTKVCPPFYSRFCHTTRRVPDLALLNSYAGCLAGRHDFSTFTAAGDQSKSREREIYSAVFFNQGMFTVFKIAGNAFLWRMVRSLTGTMLELEEAGSAAGIMKGILESKNREKAGTTAPAKGLFLHKVIYDKTGNY